MIRIQRQLSASVSTPPSSAPEAPPIAPIAPHSPSARLRSAPSGKLVVRIESVAGATIAPPSPCAARAATSVSSFWARPPASEARANSASPPANTSRRPSRSAARPPSSRKPAKASVYAFTTHARLAGVNPRSAAIEGSATFTIETSRMTMNCARQQRTSVRVARRASVIRLH